MLNFLPKLRPGALATRLLILKNVIVFDDMIADVINNEKINPVVTELFIRGRKLNFYCFYYTLQSIERS